MIQFWYDFGSPAAYLAYTQLDRIRVILNSPDNPGRSSLIEKHSGS